MPRDGQDPGQDAPVILADLLHLAAEAIPAAEALLVKATDAVREMTAEDGKVSGAAIEAHQTAAHGLAWYATYVESLRQMNAWAAKLDGEGRFGET